MLNNKRHLLENGFSFLAVEMGLQGDWSRDVDLQKCISRISKRPTFITLYYAHESTEVTWSGGLDFSLEHNPPICLGVYKVKGKQNGFTLQGLDEKTAKECLADPYKDNKEYIDKYNKDMSKYDNKKTA
jgi:hypothetical protein